MPAVSGLEKEFPGQVHAQNLDASTPEAAATIKQLGFSSHGLVIRSESGEVLFTQPDHTVKIDDVRAALHRLLAD